MDQKDKELVLKELLARLIYGVVINIGDRDLKLDKKHQCIGVLYPEDCSDEFNERNNNASFYIIISGCYYGEEIKPYLRPMSSMTKDEWDTYRRTWKLVEHDLEDTYEPCVESYDWLNAHHFDYRGLIKRGLALEAPKGMYDNNRIISSN